MRKIQAMELADNAIGDLPMLPYLLDQVLPMRSLPVSAAMVPVITNAVTKRLRNVGADDYPYSQERQAMEGPAPRCHCPQRYFGSHASA